MVADSNEVAICWEKVNRINPQFRIAYPYAPAPDAAGLLAVYALFASLDEILIETSDENVARQKLAWWQSELLSANLQNSRHPVLTVYRDSGAAERIPVAMLGRLVMTIDRLLDADAPSGEAELVALCNEVCRPRCEIESALCGPAAEAGAPRENLTRSGGMRLLLQIGFCGRQAEGQRFWWIPLGILAKFGIRRDELMLAENLETTKQLFRELLGIVLATDATDSLTDGLNQSLMGHLQLRLLSRLRSRSPDSYARELSRVTVGDAFSVWGRARRLRSRVASDR